MRRRPLLGDSNDASGNPILELLRPRYRRTTIAIWAAAFLSLFCIFGLSGWIPTVMIQRGETFAASFGFGALMQIMSFIGGIALGHLVDRFGLGRGLLSLWWVARRLRGADAGVPQRPCRERHLRRRRRILHHRRAVRAQQFHGGGLRDAMCGQPPSAWSSASAGSAPSSGRSSPARCSRPIRARCRCSSRSAWRRSRRAGSSCSPAAASTEASHVSV